MAFVHLSGKPQSKLHTEINVQWSIKGYNQANPVEQKHEEVISGSAIKYTCKTNGAVSAVSCNLQTHCHFPQQFISFFFHFQTSGLNGVFYDCQCHQWFYFNWKCSISNKEKKGLGGQFWMLSIHVSMMKSNLNWYSVEINNEFVINLSLVK